MMRPASAGILRVLLLTLTALLPVGSAARADDGTELRAALARADQSATPRPATASSARLAARPPPNLRGVFEVAQHATSTARRIGLMREEQRSQIMARLERRATQGLALLETLYQRPVVTVATASESLALKLPGANDLARRLCEVGVLRPMSEGKRNRQFAYGDFLDLFHDAETPAPPVG